MNATLIQSKFHIANAAWDRADAALREWLRKYRERPGPKLWFKTETTDSFAGILYILGYDVVFDGKDVVGIQQNDCDSVSREHVAALATLNGSVTPGSYLVFHTSADTLMRWRWGTDGLFHVEEGGTIFFGERDSLLIEVRATLQTVRNDLARGAFTAGPTYLKRIDQLLKELREPSKPNEEAK